MSGTVEGGRKAAATNKKRYGADFYKVNGAKGGRNGHTGGFAANRELARIAGAKGGKISRRGEAKKSLEERREEALDYISFLLSSSRDKGDTHKGFLSRLFGEHNGKD